MTEQDWMDWRRFFPNSDPGNFYTKRHKKNKQFCSIPELLVWCNNVGRYIRMNGTAAEGVKIMSKQTKSASHSQRSTFVRKLAVFCAAALMAVSVSACGGKPGSTASGTAASQSAGQETSGQPAEGGKFVFGIATEVYNFDPFTATTADAKGIYFNIYEGLVKTTEEGDFVPAVADSVDVSEDASVYTVHLRDGVKFHNGNEVTMEDVKWSVQKAIDSGLPGYDEISSAEAADDRTLVITLTAPDTGFKAYMTTAIVPAGSEDLALNPVGTGPFAFGEYAEQDHVTLKKNEAYWGTPAHLDEVEVKFIASSSEELIGFQAGTIDGFEGNAGITQQVDEQTANIYTRNSNAVQLMALNNSFEPFQDVRVRQALNYAVNAQEIIDTVNYGFGVACGTPVIPGLTKYFNEDLTHAYDVNTEKAKELLKEAGYEDLTFKITVPSVYQVHVDTAQVLVNELAAIGVKAEIEQVDWATWLESCYMNRQYEATVISVDGAVAYPTAFLERYLSDSSSNFVNYRSETFDKAYRAACAETDDARKAELFREAQKILSDEAASVYIQDMSSINLYNKKFEGFAAYPLYACDFAAIYQVQ